MYQRPVQSLLVAHLLGAAGVNAQIGLLTTDGLLVGTDAAPPVFATGAIASEFEDDNVADGDFPAGNPSLAISQVSQTQFPGEIMSLAGTRQGDQFPVMLRYFRDLEDSSREALDWDYTARAIIRSFRILMTQAYNSARNVAGVGIVSLDSFVYLEPFQTRNGSRATGGLGLLLTIKDIKP